MKALLSTSRLRRATRAAPLLALLLGACDDAATTAPPAPVEIAIEPAGPLELSVGDTLRLTVRLRNAPGPGVAFSSSAPSVVRADPDGLIAALSPGAATVVAASARDPAARAELSVRVLPASAAVSVSGITDASGAFVDPDRLGGTVRVGISLRPGGARELRVLLGDRVVCAEPLDAEREGASCAIDTAAFDSSSGQPVFLNGPFQLSVRLVAEDGRILASAAPDSVRLANSDRLETSVSATRSAADSLGRVWWGGDVEVRAVPVLYSGQAPPQRVHFRYDPPGRDALLRTDGAPPFAATLRAEELGELLDPNFFLTVTAAPAPSVVGGRTTTVAGRYDGIPPRAGALLPIDWVGAATPFASRYDARSLREEGVGGVSVRFFAGPPAASPAGIVAEGVGVEKGADLRESAAGAFRLAARVCDALENCSLLAGFPFGVDLQPPSVAAVSLPERAINPAAAPALALQDARSGLGARPLLATVTRLGADAPTASCGPPLGGIDLPGRLVDGTCVADTVATLPLPRGASGYFVYRIVPIDRAGNQGAAITRTVLIDRVAPSVTFVDHGPLTGQVDSLWVRTELTDDLDLARAEAYLVYRAPGEGRLAIAFARPDSIGAPFDSALVARHSARFSLPPVSSLTVLNPVDPSRRPVLAADSLVVRASDAAGQSTGFALPVALSRSSSPPFALLRSGGLTLSAQVICTSRCLGSDPRKTTITASVTGPAGLPNPFSGGRMYFFSQRAGEPAFLLGTDGGASVSETGTERVLSYSLEYQPPAGAEGEVAIFAVGTNRAGDGLKVGGPSLRFIGR